ncbi:gp374 [Bacillus phage G]|uniref:Gp374 n=1 Tax=Bacillus phage G TaxID=2884420 RepID=G3MAB5_9CAUD|nr:gp374 [Bacillus phage G]AEO93633.1 gp374 [Bacillus phage G]
MANYDGIILNDIIFTCTRKKKVYNVDIINLYNFEATRNININPVTIIELLPDFRDENDEYGATKQINNFDAVFPFGDSQSPPRRTPLENSWTRNRN